MKVVVIARVEALPGHEAEVADLLCARIAPTLEEKGCVNYDLHREHANPCVFWFHETWATEADLDAHSCAPHLLASRANLEPHLASTPDVYRLKKLS